MLIGILVDEYLKEGYIFCVWDILKFGTHENIFLIVLFVGLLIYMFGRRLGLDEGDKM